MILCVCLNPAVDVTYRLDAGLHPGHTHRVTSQEQRAGGKTLNVARLLTDRGIACTLLAPLGADTGRSIRADLAATAIRTSFVEITGPTRRTVVVVDPTDATVLNEPGPPLSGTEWAAVLERYQALLPTADLVVMSGSLPPGVPADAYRVLTALAAEHDLPALVDAGGPTLRAALAAHPYLVKPNLAELAGISSGPLHSTADIVAAGHELLALGARNAVISCGSDGLVAVTETGSWHARAGLVTGNPTGAGDALVAALAAATVSDLPWPDRLRAGAGMSAAAVADPVAGHVDPNLQSALTAGVTLTPLPAPSAASPPTLPP
jgi:tagatose 6-phosphate kinase